MTRRRIQPSTIAFAAVGAVAVAWLLFQTRHTLFYFDEWEFWDSRRGYSLAHLFDPVNEHASFVPALLYNLVQSLTGGVDSLPYRLLAAAYHLSFISALFVYVRRRIGGPLALCVVAPIAFLGTAWLVLLMPLSTIQIVGPLAFGMASLLLLDGDGRWREIAAATLLTLALFSWGGGLAIFAGVAVLIALERRRDRIWVLLVPAVLWGAWYLVERPGSGFELHDLTLIPRYVAEGTAAGFSSYTDLSKGWGWVLAAGLGVALVLSLWRRRGMSPQLAAVCAMALAFWALIAISRGPEITPDEVRYHYTDAALVITISVLLAPAAVSRWRLASPQVVLALILAAAFTVPNLKDFRTAGRNYRADAALSRADVFAIEVARDRVHPDFEPAPDRDPELDAGHILHSLDDGKVLVSAADIRGALEVVRERADATLVGALRLKTKPVDGARIATGARPPRVVSLNNAKARFASGCVGLDPQLGTATIEIVAPERLTVDPRGGRAEVRLRRFGSGFPAGRPFAQVDGASRLIRFKPDRSRAPWHVRVESGSAVRLCRAVK